jgi:uncharacterized Zn-binding protein involved in type VI secretion
MGIVSLVGQDSAGGVITGPGAPAWTWNGKPISLLGDGVAGHGVGAHAGPAIVTASPWMTINGVPVTRVGSVANCGHGATGSSDMDIP